MDKKQRVLEWLEANRVEYKLVEHTAAFTIEDMDKLQIDGNGHVCKNLFLRDAKGKRHFLLLLQGDKNADLRALGDQMSIRFSFASEDRLATYLQLEKGAVTPLGVYFDREAEVELLIDSDLLEIQTIGVHPAVNTATVFMAFSDLRRLVASNGNSITVVHV